MDWKQTEDTLYELKQEKFIHYQHASGISQTYVDSYCVPDQVMLFNLALVYVKQRQSHADVDTITALV